MDPIAECCTSEMPLTKCCDTTVENSVNGRLQNVKKRLESQLTEVNEALEALEKNPEIARVLTLVSKASRH